MDKHADSCEWMYTDVATGLLGIQALARYNPLRWSGEITFDECIKQLEEARQKTDSGVVVKVPAGISSEENEFSDIASAIAFVENKDPVRRREKLAAQKAEEEQKLEVEQAEIMRAELMRAADEARRQAYKEECIEAAKEKFVYYDATLKETAKHIEELNAVKFCTTFAMAAAKDIDCAWMFGDLGGPASWNPLRWSGALSVEVAVEQLESKNKAGSRPIHVKVPAGVRSAEHRFPDCQAAIDFINNHNPNHLKLQTEEVEVALQNAMKTMDDAKDKLQEYKVELRALLEVEELPEVDLTYVSASRTIRKPSHGS